MFKAKRKAKEKIIEGSSVFADGQRYTLYQIFGEDEAEEDLRAKGVRKVDGGGVAWRDARLECKKRRKQLAMIFTNEAAIVVANAMLKSRPCNNNKTSFIIHTRQTRLSCLLDKSREKRKKIGNHKFRQ